MVVDYMIRKSGIKIYEEVLQDLFNNKKEFLLVEKILPTQASFYKNTEFYKR